MSEVDWGAYASVRNLSRNRLLLPHHQEMVDDFLRVFAPIPQETHVLDIGPANGFFLAILRELGITNTHALDPSPEFLSCLRAKNLVGFAGNIITREGVDALSPPYDAITLMEVLEHLAEPKQALENIRSLLGPKGFLYLTVPSCDCIFDRLRRTSGRVTREMQVRAIDETHLHAFTPQTLRAVLGEAGFRVEWMRRLSFRFPGRLDYYPGRRLHLFMRAMLPAWTRGLCLSALARPYTESRA